MGNFCGGNNKSENENLINPILPDSSKLPETNDLKKSIDSQKSEKILVSGINSRNNSNFQRRKKYHSSDTSGDTFDSQILENYTSSYEMKQADIKKEIVKTKPIVIPYPTKVNSTKNKVIIQQDKEEVPCKNCLRKFFRYKDSVDNNYCDKECEYSFQYRTIIAICDYCEQEFYKRNIDENIRFCGNSCFKQVQK